jgi:hypothetical protein
LIIYKKKSIYLKINKIWRFSGKATQFRGDKSDIVSSIYKLCARNLQNSGENKKENKTIKNWRRKEIFTSERKQ